MNVFEAIRLIGPMNQYSQHRSTETVDNASSFGDKSRIMISGMHHDTRFMMRVLLEMWGYEVVEAAGADDTVRIAESEHPSLILVDTARSYQQDLEVVARVRQSDIPNGIPIIMLSGFPQMNDQKAAFEHGATGLLVKPLDLDLLESYLETWLH